MGSGVTTNHQNLNFFSLILGTLCNSYLAQGTYACAHISKFITAFQVFHTFWELELQSFNLSYYW
jgi:hypothetical protein